MLTNSHVKNGLAGFDHTYRNVHSEAVLFERKCTSTSEAWYWAYDALIHWRRGNRACAVASWRYAVRLTLGGFAALREPKGGAA